MAPRKQKRKARLSRMDAAIDAMLPYGFARRQVRKVTTQLLKEYGGDEGWPFIEEYSYKELLEAILRDVEASEQKTTAEHGNSSQVDSNDENLAGAEDNVVQGAELLFHPADATCSEVDPSKGKGIGLGGTSRQKEMETETSNKGELRAAAHLSHRSSPDPASAVPFVATCQHTANKRRRPCYGGIESDEDDADDFLYLAPTVGSKPTAP